MGSNIISVDMIKGQFTTISGGKAKLDWTADIC
jgi:hypothetical protein